jgi:tetratricopeptide (TPR) repeat protein
MIGGDHAVKGADAVENGNGWALLPTSNLSGGRSFFGVHRLSGRGAAGFLRPETLDLRVAHPTERWWCGSLDRSVRGIWRFPACKAPLGASNPPDPFQLTKLADVVQLSLCFASCCPYARAYGETLMRTSIALALCMLVTGWIAAARADDKTDCRNGKDVDLKIRSCAVLIERDTKDAVAYYNRASAYQSKGEIDRAIADYDQAIGLKPDYVQAYENRAGAFVSKGDYTRAVADVTKAGEITSSVAVQSKAAPTAAKPVKTSAHVRAASILKKSAPAWPNWADGWPDWAPK